MQSSSSETSQSEESVHESNDEIETTDSNKDPTSSSAHSEEENLADSHESERRTDSSECVDRMDELLMAKSSQLVQEQAGSKYVGNLSKLAGSKPRRSGEIDDVSNCVSAMLELLITDSHLSERKQGNRKTVRRASKLPIPIEIVNETKLCIKQLKKSIEKEKRYQKPNSNLVWNKKVLKFLKNNIKHAYKTNAALSKET